MSDNWTMPRRAEQCAACERTFDIGETFQAFLYEAEEGYARRDYCLDCVPADQALVIGAWKTRRPEPATRKVHPFDREAIFGFFERLADAEQPHQVQFRFVLALLLWRKKVLKLERTAEEDGHEVWEFLVPRTGVVHHVRRPELDEEQLQHLSEQLELLLAGQPGELDTVAREISEENEDA